MGIASDEDLLSQRLHQPEHGLDAEGAASGAEKTAGCAVQLGVEPFGFGDGALGFKKTVGAPDFGEVPGGHCREEAQGRSFMPRRVEPGKILPAQPFDGVEQGGEGSVHGYARLSGEILCLSYNKRRQLASRLRRAVLWRPAGMGGVRECVAPA